MSALVVKLGGHALDSLEPASSVLVDLAQDVVELGARGVRVVVVHGGGPQIAGLLTSVGLASRFHEGLRVTDVATMDYVAMALGQVNLKVTAALNAAGLSSVGLSGADDSLISATAIGEPWGCVGDGLAINADIIETLWASDVTPVVSSVAVDAGGELLNCNADTVAGALARAVGAETLVLLSDIDQVRTDPDDTSTSLTSLSAQHARELLASGAAREGMRPKLAAALDGLDAGATRVLMANGTRRHALREALEGLIPTTEVRQ